MCIRDSTNPEKTVSSIKREMGSNYKVNIDGKDYTPQEISAMILTKLKTDAEAYLGCLLYTSTIYHRTKQNTGMSLSNYVARRKMIKACLLYTSRCV